MKNLIYSMVVSRGLILPKKAVYTMRDAKKIVSDSLGSIALQQAVFITKCSALYHDTDYSKSVGRFNGDNILIAQL